MESFHQPIRLQVIGGGGHVLNVEESAKGSPYCRGKLGTPVAGDCRWQPKPLHPSREECGCAVGGGSGGDWYSFRPPCGPVHDCKQVGINARLGKGSHQVNVQV